MNPETNGSFASCPSCFIATAFFRLHEGYAAADPLALEGLILLHAPTPIVGLSGTTRPALPDTLRFLGYTRLMQRLYGEDSVGMVVAGIAAFLQQGLDPAIAQRMERQVETEASKWQAAGRLRNMDATRFPPLDSAGTGLDACSDPE